MRPSHIFLLNCLWILLSNYSFGNNLQRFDQLDREIESIGFTQGTKAHSLLQDLYQIAQNDPDSIRLTVRCIFREAVLGFAQGIHDDQMSRKIQTILQRLDDKKNPVEKAKMFYALALNYTTTGNYAEAFSTSLQALEHFKTLNDTLYIAKTYNLLGIVCSYIKNNRMAENYYLQGSQLVNPQQTEYYQIKCNWFRLLFYDHHYEAAIDSFLYFLPQIQHFGDTGILALAYLNLGACYTVKNEYQEASHYYESATKLIQNIDNKKLKLSLNQHLGIFHFMMNDFKKAFSYFTKAQHLAIQDDDLAQLSSSLYNISQTFFKLKNIDSAYYYLEAHRELNNQIVNNSQAIETYQAYITAFMEASENKLVIAEQQITLKNRQFAVVIILSISLILLILLLLIVVQQQKRLKVAENKDLSDRLTQEKKIQHLQEEKHSEAIESKIREITSYSLLLSNKNNILKQIDSLTKQLPDKEKEVVNIRKKINQIVKANFNADNDWENFKLHFDKVHPSFFDHLKTFCDNLTETNLRLCAYSRIGLSIKQIAQMLNISPGSVVIHRYRLKKKLGLIEEENLDDFLRSI